MLHEIFNAQLIAEAFGAGATIFILGGLGYMFTDRAGVFNITIEGLLLFSAFFAAVVDGTTNNLWLGIGAGVASSIVVSIIFFAVSIGLRADIIVVGIAINLLASSVTVFLLSVWFGNQGLYQPLNLPIVPNASIPLLDRLPVLGPTFSDQSLFTYVAWLMVPVCIVLLYHTPLGLRIRSVGENPEAAATVGINVVRTQFIAIMICAVLCGIGGCYLSIGPLAGFNRDMSAGQGWIALAAETLGAGTPLGTFVSAVFFGAAQGMASNMQAVGIGASGLAHAIPYAVTVIGLGLASWREFIRRRIRRRRTPAAPTAAEVTPAPQPVSGG